MKITANLELCILQDYPSELREFLRQSLRKLLFNRPVIKENLNRIHQAERLSQQGKAGGNEKYQKG